MDIKKTALLAFFVFFLAVCYSNPISKDLLHFNDSVQNVINKEKDHKKLLNTITDLLNRNYVTNKPFIINYIEKNILNNPIYLEDTLFYANTLNTYSICFLETDVDKSIEVAKSAINYIGDSEEPEILEKLALLNSNLANALAVKGHHHTRLKVFTDIYPLILKTKNPQIIRNYNHKLGSTYYVFNDLDRALEHLHKGIFVEEDFVYHPNFAGVTETFIASVYMKKNQIDSVRKYANIANNIKRAEIPALFTARIKNLLGLSEAYKGNFYKAYAQIYEAHQIAQSLADTSEILYSKFMKGKCLALQHQYNQAIATYNVVIENDSNPDFNHYTYYVLKNLVEAYKANGQHEKAFETYDRLLKFLDEQKAQNELRYADELNYNMKFNEKLAEIEILKASNEKAAIEKEKNQLFIGGLVLCLLLLVLILFMVVKAQKRKKMIAQQEYALLEAKLDEEKNNHTIDEMKLLKQVENRERNRIATDLHDSLGGLLSSIKIALFDYQESKELNAEELEHTDRILEYVDETKQELNRIVYNLTPLVVEKFGLLEAIKQYCKKIQSENFNIFLQIISVPASIVVEDEITLYRIIQEILHNIVKHANAKSALVQIQTNYDNGMVMISIEDDGVGMDLENLKIKSGLGLRSLYSRVQSLNGTIKIESQKDIGTSIYISCIPRALEKEI